MYPFLRFAKTLAKSSYQYFKGDTLSLDTAATLDFRALPHDLDAYLEMNNGRILTLFDLGRTDFAIRSGLGKQLVKKRWGLVVAGSSVQYRRRIRVFNRVQMRTQLEAVDARWFYMTQTLWLAPKNDQDSAICACHLLTRTGVTSLKTGKVLPTQNVLAAIDQADFSKPAANWVQAWIDADKLRPFGASNSLSNLNDQ